MMAIDSSIRRKFFFHYIWILAIVIAGSVIIIEKSKVRTIKRALGTTLISVAEKRIVEAGGVIDDPFFAQLQIYNDYSSLPVMAQQVLKETANEEERVHFSRELIDERYYLAIMPYAENALKTTYFVIKIEEAAIPTKYKRIEAEILVPIFLTLIFALSVPLILARQVITPLKDLEKFAQGSRYKLIPIPDSLEQRKDEFGRVGLVLQESLRQVWNHQEQEKQFLQNASHELRTPLATIGSALHVVKVRLNNGKSIDTQLEQIERSYEQMTQLTQALLLLSQSKANFEPTEFDLSSMIQSRVEQLKYLLGPRDVQVNLNSDSSITLRQAQVLLDIAITNLFRNAFEHTLEGSIDIDFDANGIRVQNPILPDQQVHFGRGEGRGFGLGLHILKQVADQQQWTFSFNQDEQYLTVNLAWG
ncbi:HAMP domain-containing sensor histidine kinase [Microbulbifer sp. A4B17]|uniref:sensor histidine kinase n=1 Tax=Microbulbifer sp. A4B17 TaxID=359370 RepID=UPI001300781B|nr:HAMP domain-containing sensor histidine kinase [Microbulbifer sp. A4B17]